MQKSVFSKSARTIKCFVTYVTRVRSLASVNKFVIFQTTTLSEAFAAYITFKWFFTTVSSLVSEKCMTSFKGFMAHIAFE